MKTRTCITCRRVSPPNPLAVALDDATCECRNCYRRRRRAEDGRYNYEQRVGKRGEQKRAWDNANRGRRRDAA